MVALLLSREVEVPVGIEVSGCWAPARRLAALAVQPALQLLVVQLTHLGPGQPRSQRTCRRLRHYAEVLGEKTRCPNKRCLVRRITETLEAGTGQTSAQNDNDASAVETTPDEAIAEPANDTPITDAPSEPTSDGESVAEHTNDASEIETSSEDDALAPANANGLGRTDAPTGDDDNDKATRLTKLSVSELQALYAEVVGRPTGSSAKRYVVWKIRQAQRGGIPVGPRDRTRGDGPAPDFKVLPLRMEADLVAQLDEPASGWGSRAVWTSSAARCTPSCWRRARSGSPRCSRRRRRCPATTRSVA